MDIRKVKKLIELVEEAGIAELEIHEGEESVRIIRHGDAPASPSLAFPSPSPSAASANLAPSGPLSERIPDAPPPDPDATPEGHIVTSPMVGTFFVAPGPNVPPLAPLGHAVEVGDTLCIIEAMKIFNQIEADRAGVVAAVLVENGHPVEYGQPLFVIQ